MNKLYLLIAFLFLAFFSSFNTKESLFTEDPELLSNKLFECFIIEDNEITIYKKDRKTIIDTLKNDLVNEDYFVLSFLNGDENWFQIKAKSINEEKNGWINIENSHIGIYSKNYTDTLKLRRLPIDSSNINCYIPYYYTKPLRFLYHEEGWLKVKTSEDSIICEGWVKKSQLCGNPYSTCP